MANIFNPQVIENNMGDLPEIIRSIVLMYLEESTTLVADLISGIHNDDPKLIESCAHSMKTSSAYAGCEELQTLFSSMEKASKDENNELCKGLLVQLQPAFEQACAEMKNWLHNLPSAGNNHE